MMTSSMKFSTWLEAAQLGVNPTRLNARKSSTPSAHNWNGIRGIGFRDGSVRDVIGIP